MNLTKDISLNELLRSDFATRKDIKEQFEPNATVIENLKNLAINVLQPIEDNLREGVNSNQVIISSGYRCERLNKAIGGAKFSQHLVGEAADINVKGISTVDLVNKIKSWGIPFDQMIEEFGAWVHISFKKGNNRGQVLRATKKNRKTIYSPF